MNAESNLPTTRSGEHGAVTIHAPGLAIITDMARGGHPAASIAAALAMSGRIFRECRKRQPEVEEAFAVGLGGLEHELVHTLLAQARKGNVAAAMFLLKCRHGYRETGVTDSAPKVAVQINLPGAMDERAYATMIEKEARHVDA
jgi:arginine/lysine/ornithine decarboxylase